MAKSRKLVIQHLENVSRKVLESYPSIITSMIRGHSGIYALYRRGRLHYVGLASNLVTRLKQHLRDRHGNQWDRFSVYLTVHDEHMKELESLLLRIATPKGNKQSGRFMASQNLRPVLNREIKNFDDDRRAYLLGGHVARRRRRIKARGKKGASALHGAVDRRTKLRATYKGTVYTAWRRRNGSIYYDGQVYESPTGAAKAIVKRAISGWGFWRYKNAKGEWVRLGTMRK